MRRLPQWLVRGVRWGLANAQQVEQVARGAAEVAVETRDAFRRGLRGEPEPPPKARRTPTPEEVAAWYANLEVEEGADLDAVHRAWKRLQRKYHPDLHAADDARAARATELIQRLNAAYAGLRAYLDR